MRARYISAAMIVLVVFCGAAICYLSFCLAYETEGGYFYLGDVVQASICSIIASIVYWIVCAGLRLTMVRNHRFLPIAGAVWLFLAASSLSGFLAGEIVWNYTFQTNRSRANAVVDTVKQYHSQTGRYPMTWEEISDEPLPTIQRGNRTSPIEYYIDYSGSPIVSYDYGWYTYVFRFAEDRWACKD
jgi:hypothetical protein